MRQGLPVDSKKIDSDQTKPDAGIKAPIELSKESANAMFELFKYKLEASLGKKIYDYFGMAAEGKLLDKGDCYFEPGTGSNFYVRKVEITEDGEADGTTILEIVKKDGGSYLVTSGSTYFGGMDFRERRSSRVGREWSGTENHLILKGNSKEINDFIPTVVQWGQEYWEAKYYSHTLGERVNRLKMLKERWKGQLNASALEGIESEIKAAMIEASSE